ncbi:SRPBCC domain-containing protein [Arthrobacter sp. I2-34]|uniref:SRPBCC domain-containing protein n=1 Tax=Arthrobacter hankyongi TaxID=2904801 RepID=A0ABS9L698_9MICC|nr:SRPBCC domain-containing protein [Arthrobacter hankyongi]MCG2622012.1 SRPBCC domain-containing protein [Arthrobacter hankyongi]
MTESTDQDTTLFLTRVFDAPRELVFKAFIDPDQLAQWFGPVGVSTPRDRIEVEPRVGGVWKLTMIMDEDGTPSPVDAVITRFVEPELLEAHISAEAMDRQSTHLDVSMLLTFEDDGGRTRLTLRQGPFPSRDWTDQTHEGWESSFTKLDALLAR